MNLLRVNALNNKNSNPYAAMFNRKQTGGTMSKTNDLRAKLRALSNNDHKSVYDGFSSSKSGNLLINTTLDYGATIRNQRQQKKDSLLQLKTLKYRFKSVSSSLLRAKTSTSARQVAGQAAREVIRLRREKMKGDCDSTEIEAAINHAKAMERVARRKVKHLEQEEMAKASGGHGLYEETEIEVKEGERNVENDESDDNIKTDEMSEEMTETLEELEEMSEDIIEDTENLDLEDLSELDDLLAVETDMEPEDLKMLTIKHRNREMKEIVQADSEYLRVIFDHLEQMSGEPVVDVAL